MGLEELRKGVLDKAQEEARAQARDADAEAAGLMAKAEAQRKELLDAASREAKEMVEAERGEAIANAHLEAKRELAKAKEELVASVEERVWKELLAVRKNKKEYAALLHKLIEKGRKALQEESAGEVLAYLNADDKKLVLEIKGVKLARETIECAGGAVVTSADGRVRIDNTLEALFAEKRDAMRIEIQKAVLSP
jgi:V/A-type H+-transporting ATPase subunit E